jgi:methylthioribose-1-phosphate isomerase
MQVRGAPAIGCTAAYGMALAALASPAPDRAGVLADLDRAKAQLDAARPTAVNLAWATARVLARAAATPGDLRTVVLAEAHAILAEDQAMCRAIGAHGAALIPDSGQVLTHCNAGGLATSGYGTALAPIRTAFELGRTIHVLVDETRPLLQGARLTAWELQQVGVPCTLIADNMAAAMMRAGRVGCVIVGADRVAANGDVANKIGTYGVAVLARAHDIPFYVAMPSSTIDVAIATGDAIPIEQRGAEEVRELAGTLVAPADVAVANPAFDVTPHELVSAFITEHGVLRAPFAAGLRAAVQR